MLLNSLMTSHDTDNKIQNSVLASQGLASGIFSNLSFYPWFPNSQSCHSLQFSSVQFSRSVMSDSATPWIAVCQASLSITNSRSLLKFMSIKSVMPSSHLILCCPFFLLPPIPSSIRVFSNESTLRIRWPKYWSFSFSISPSNEHPGLISFRMDWLDLLAVQGTLKSLLQHHSSKASTFWCSAYQSSNTASMLLPQGFCVCYFLSLGCMCPSNEHNSLSHLILCSNIASSLRSCLDTLSKVVIAVFLFPFTPFTFHYSLYHYLVYACILSCCSLLTLRPCGL